MTVSPLYNHKKKEQQPPMFLFSFYYWKSSNRQCLNIDIITMIEENTK
jgi:hypothetical protein